MSHNRNKRRMAAKAGRKMIAKTVEDKGELSRTMMFYFATEMAKSGGGLLALVKEHNGGNEVTSGYVVDALMRCAAGMEDAMAKGDAQEFVAAATSVLFFARDIAIREGKIRPAQQAPSAKA